jgi:hypothetical protein
MMATLEGCMKPRRVEFGPQLTTEQLQHEWLDRLQRMTQGIWCQQPSSGCQLPDTLVSGPKRIQRKRTRGWRMPEGTVYVGRPTRWGNPFRIGSPNADDCVVCGSPEEAVEKYRSELTTLNGSIPLVGATAEEIKRELRGKDLCCWCPLDQPCHADVLLEIANA